MPQNSSALTEGSTGPTIAQIRDWTEQLLRQGVDPKTRLTITTQPYYNQFDAGSWTIRCNWEKK